MVRLAILILLLVFLSAYSFGYGEEVGSDYDDYSIPCLRDAVDAKIDKLPSMSQDRFEYARRLEELGCVWGYYYLSDFYGAGNFVDQDHKRAITLLSRAVTCGDERAVHRLAGYYSFGIQVKKDLQIAYSLYVLADFLGSRGSSFLAKKLGSNMSEEDKKIGIENARMVYGLLENEECLSGSHFRELFNE